LLKDYLARVILSAAKSLLIMWIIALQILRRLQLAEQAKAGALPHAGPETSNEQQSIYN
jgi:hypothetical protein